MLDLGEDFGSLRFGNESFCRLEEALQCDDFRRGIQRSVGEAQRRGYSLASIEGDGDGLDSSLVDGGDVGYDQSSPRSEKLGEVPNVRFDWGGTDGCPPFDPSASGRRR